MKMLYQKLTDWGCDVPGAMERFLGDEELYEECLQQFCEDDNFAKLGIALEEGDIKAAFDNAHTLKGVSGNMGITPMYKTVMALVEPLRGGSDTGVAPLYKELMEEKAYLDSLIESK